MGLIHDSVRSHAYAHFLLSLVFHNRSRPPNIWQNSSKNKMAFFYHKKEISYLCHIYRMLHNVFLRLLSYDVLPPSVYQEPTVTRVQEVLCQDSQVLKFLIAKRVLFGHSNRYKNDNLWNKYLYCWSICRSYIILKFISGFNGPGKNNLMQNNDLKYKTLVGLVFYHSTNIYKEL